MYSETGKIEPPWKAAVYLKLWFRASLCSNVAPVWYTLSSLSVKLSK